jgi:uncharacterized DUF497 family protein
MKLEFEWHKSKREQRLRIISGRRATQYEQDDYFQQNA